MLEKSKFFKKNSSIFSKKVQFVFSISVAFYGKFASIYWKKIQVEKREQNLPMLTCKV